MFKVEAKRTSEGNYNVQATCPSGHTGFKKAGDNKSAYKCSYCGLDMP